MLLAPPGAAVASGFRLPDQDAFATARGEAFAATADNPSAIYYNPAGITQLPGHQLRGGIYGLKLNVSYESPSGQSFDNEADLHAVPQLFYTYGDGNLPLALGLGVYSPYGLSSKWPQDTGFRTVATEGRLTYVTVNPVVAWRINPQLSIAAGLTVNYADANLQQGFASPLPGAGDTFKLQGNAVVFGFNAGVLWKPLEQLQFGVNYRSATSADLSGTTDFTSPVFNSTQRGEADFDFPQNVVFGVSWRPTPKWNLEFNLDWTDWNRLNTIAIRQPPMPDASLVLNWESSFYYEFGATRYLDGGWSVSAGYIFNENSVPDAHYQPLVADQNRHFFSTGFGWQGGHFSADFAYQFGYGPTRTVTGSAPSLLGQTADGDYRFLSHALLASLGWRF
ncbi:MAG: outer membrane protein transport protein [Verrucomicrobiae bacterium]|nr:outer membrane protein transport protein [Verrucomicrobiae bacterium]